MKKTLFLLLLLAAVFSCKKNDNCTPQPEETVEYLIFGQSSCFCWECCKTGYKIAGDKLYKGEKDDQGKYAFETTPLDSAKYQIAKKVLDEFPDELLPDNGKTFGCNGCADQPVYYVELKKGGKVYFWNLDSVTDGFPQYVKDYSALLGEAMAQLQQ